MTMTFGEFVKTFLDGIIGHPSYKLCSDTIQLQVSHLSFVVNTICEYSEETNTILELWKSVKDDLDCGKTSWDDVDYFQQWEGKIVKILEPESSYDDNLCPDPEEVSTPYCDEEKIKSEQSILINFSKPTHIELKTKKVKNELGRIIEVGRKRKRNRKGKFSCDLCDLQDCPKAQILKHKFNDHGQTGCDECGINFDNFEEYRKHNIKHENACQFCNRMFTTVKSLKTHLEIKHGGENNEPIEKEICPHCGELFTYLTNHIQTKHLKSVIKKLKCSDCDYVCSNKDHLVKHRRRRHEEANPVNCPWCGKWVKELDQHLKKNQCNIPEEERAIKERFQCHLCDKSFIGKQHLGRHLRSIHEKIKDFHCKLCEYKTDSKANLYIHVKRMHEGRPLKEACPHCEKVVVNLEYHVKTYHTVQ